MRQQGVILVRAGDAVHPLTLSSRDVYLLDGRYFFPDSPYRSLFRLDFLKGMKAPPLDTPLVSHSKFVFTQDMRDLLVAFETQRDLISFDYSYGFEDEKGIRHSGAQSGFRVEGGYGYIDCRPAGYCLLTVSDVGPNGKGRHHTIIDMRVKRQFPTLDKGMLRVYTRKADVRWFDELGKLISFLEHQSAETIEISHSVV